MRTIHNKGTISVLIATLAALLLTATVLIGTVGMLSSTFSVKADKENNTDSEEDRITQGDIDKIQSELEALGKEQLRLENELAAAKENSAQKAALILSYEALITNYKKEIYVTQEIISAYDSLITLKSRELSDKQTEYSRMVISYKDKLRFTHETSVFTTLQMVFSAESFSDFLTSSIRFGDILDHTNTIMAKLEACALEIEETLSELNTVKSEKTVYVASLNDKKFKTETLLAEAEQEKKLLDDEAEATRVLLEYYEAQHKKTDEELTQLLKDYAEQIRREEEKAEQDRLEKEEQEKLEKERAEQKKWLWPLDPYYKNGDARNIYITSTFGGRIHPVHNKPMNHSGVDIAGRSSGIIAGDNIYAARAGTVIIAGYGAGYGNYVVIDHGDDENGKRLTSVYAHCTTLFVEKGDKIARGTKVGSVGMTGTATGYHLHFEIRVDGEKTDPLDYSYIFKTGETPVPAEKFIKFR
ncbi:MAG: hypothetical protein E7599_07915 [Ruminococcaceae bacterium]|nr:hypothetical protein [Oscillospiraceae bacterium]